MYEFLVCEEKKCSCCGNKYKTLSSEGYYCTKCGQALTVTLCPDCRKIQNYICPKCGADKSLIAPDDRGCFVTEGTYKGDGQPMEVVINPWINNNWPCEEMVAKCDKDIIDDFKKKNPGELKLNLWPEVFMGNPDAPVYLLNGNPGYNENDDKFVDDPDFIDAIQKTLSHNTNVFLFLEDRWEEHSGTKYWKDHTKELRKNIKDLRNRLFNIEYFPYHSKNQDKIKNLKLPSFEYSNRLIEKAIKEKKLIVLMRNASKWIERVPKLKTYKNVLYLSSSSNTCLTPKNIVKKTSAWEVFVKGLKQQ